MERATTAEGVHLDAVEEGCQEGAHKRKPEKKERKMKVAKKEESETNHLRSNQKHSEEGCRRKC